MLYLLTYGAIALLAFVHFRRLASRSDLLVVGLLALAWPIVLCAVLTVRWLDYREQKRNEK